MPKGLQAHPAERVDLDDFTRGVRTFTQDSVAQVAATAVLDNQSRYLRGFRVELPDQTSFPGRIVVHNGDSYDPSGQKLLNEDQATASRTITLEGANTNFYVEIEFIEGDADVDGRAFWDPTVDQGTDVSGDALPDGQEFGDNVATRKSPDWRIVTPISTTAFARTSDPESTKIPLVLLRTNGSNQITNAAGVNNNLTTDKVATTLLEVLSLTLIRVQDAQLFLVNNDIVVGQGLGTAETRTISNVDVGKGLITLSAALTPGHNPGEICRAVTAAATAIDLIDESAIGRYRRDSVGAGPPNHEIDVKDKLFQGDEVHGHILSQGHDSTTFRQSDVNLQSLKDHIDFLSAQIEEMKWGYTNPYEGLESTNRNPPGIAGTIPITPRYFDRAGGLAGARTAAITVGDGSNSWGDLNGTSETVIQAAHDALPASGGRIFLKRGTYTLGADFLWTNTGIVTLEGEEGSVIQLSGGRININTTGTPRLRNLELQGDGVVARTCVYVHTSNPTGFEMEDILATNCSMDVNAVIPGSAEFRRVRFVSTNPVMSLVPLVQAVGVSAVLSGVWTECSFQHDSFNNLAGTALVDFNTAVPILSSNLLSFVDCIFSTLLNPNINLDGVSLGPSANFSQFTRCTFATLLTVVHVRIGGGSNIKFNECIGIDAVASLVQATGVNHIEVDAYVNSTGPVLFPAFDLVDCSAIKISNCDVITQSLLFGSTAGVKITAVGSDIEDVLIEGNTISGTTDNTCGILFDVAGSNIRKVRIETNLISQCACGIAFYDTAANVYENLIIEGNHIRDGDATATYQKVGIYGADNASFGRVTISNNQITNCNPGDAIVLRAGIDRQGILFNGVSTQFAVKGNQIENIGNAWFPMAGSAGILFNYLQNSTVEGNIVVDVDGNPGYGIVLSENPNTAIENIVVGNRIDAISSDATVSMGITAFKIINSVISNNQFGVITTGGAGVVCGAIGVTDLSNSTIVGSVIEGNAFTSNYADAVMILFRGLTLRNVVVAKNVVNGTYDYFCFITSTVAGLISSLTLANNNSRLSISGDVKIDPATATSEFIVISSNNFNSDTTAVANIEIDDSTHINITANVLKNANTTKNVLITASTRVAINSNIMFIPDGGDNIDLSDPGNDIYAINDNILDMGGILAPAGQNIVTLGSGSTGGSVVIDNLSDGNIAPGVDTNNNDFGTTAYANGGGQGHGVVF